MSINLNTRTSADDPSAYAPIGWRGVWWLLVVGLVTIVLCLPFVHSIFFLSDEGVLLHGAERILRGRRLYVDFFEFLPPGGFIIAAAWLGITGTSMLSVRFLAIMTIAAIACFIFLTCQQTSKRSAASAFVAIGWVILSQGLWTQVNHHWFTTLFSMITLWGTLASVEHPRRWPHSYLVAGVAAGAAAMVTPTRGALAMLAGAIAYVNVRRYRDELFGYMLVCLLVPTFVLVFLLYQGAVAAAFNSVILFAAKHYSSIQSVPFGFSETSQNAPLKYLFPVAALLTLLICVQDWYASIQDRLLRVCIAFGLAGLAGCFPRPDIAHIAFAAPLVFPLLLYCVTRITLSWPKKYQFALVAYVGAVAVPSIVSFYYVAHTAVTSEIVATARGNASFPSDSRVQELMTRIAATPSTDVYLFYPYMTMLSFVTAREQVSRYEIFVPGYTLPSQYQEACVSSMRRATWIVIDRNWTEAFFLKMFPAMRDAAPVEKKRFEFALERGFELVARDGAFEMRRRIKTVDETVCDDIGVIGKD